MNNNNVSMELLDLIDEYKCACRMNTKPVGIAKLKENHVEDENRSVKWNREFVAKNNKQYAEAVANLNRNRSLRMNEVEKQIVEYIMKKAMVGQFGANRILEFAHQQSDSLQEVGIWVEQLIELVNDCNQAPKSKTK